MNIHKFFDGNFVIYEYDRVITSIHEYDFRSGGEIFNNSTNVIKNQIYSIESAFKRIESYLDDDLKNIFIENIESLKQKYNGSKEYYDKEKELSDFHSAIDIYLKDAINYSKAPDWSKEQIINRLKNEDEKDVELRFILMQHYDKLNKRK